MLVRNLNLQSNDSDTEFHEEAIRVWLPAGSRCPTVANLGVTVWGVAAKH